MARQEQFQTFETHFERVPNEILLEILSYMTHVDAVVAFANLNIRFQNLLAEWCHTFDLTSVSKKTFDIIFQQKRLYRWDTLKLSDGERTPGQITYFLEQFEYSEKFSTVRSLSILNLKPNFDYSFFSQIQSLPNLLSLEMDLSNSKNIPNIQLPNLKKLRVIACGDTKWLLVSTAIEIILHIHSQNEICFLFRSYRIVQVWKDLSVVYLIVPLTKSHLCGRIQSNI